MSCELRAYGCEFCNGFRCPCSCTEDCGARADWHGPTCPCAPEGTPHRGEGTIA